MPIAALEEPIWIATPSVLEKMTAEISAEPILAVDTESNSLFAYREEVCLVQISTPRRDYLIDPFVLHDLSVLAPIFRSKKILKIFHAAEYDLLCLKRDFSFEFHNIFDTMIAARILGEPQVGLGSLLAARFGITLNKKYQRANWGSRPLSKEMLNYARMDTHYLFALHEELEADLKRRRLRRLAQEDFALVSQVQPQALEMNGLSCWKTASGARITSRQAAILHELCRYRDAQARKLDLPHFKVLSDDVLLQVSLASPHNEEDLKSIPGMSERLVKRHQSGLLQAVETGRHVPPPPRPTRNRPDQGFLERLGALRVWRKTYARDLKTESDVVLPRELMERIAVSDPADLDQLGSLMSGTPWRFKQYGREIMKTLKGENY